MQKYTHRIFVSSTFEDLREERAEVQNALLKLNCFPVGMEIFPSASEESWEFIKHQIEESHFYVVIVAGRYGSLAPDGMGFTEKEYDYALKLGKPSIGFLRGDVENIPNKFSESDIEARAKLEKFRRKIQTRPVRFFRSAHELATEVMASVASLREKYAPSNLKRRGDSQLSKENIDLVNEVAFLRSQLQKSRVDEPFEGHSELREVQLARGFLTFFSNKPPASIECSMGNLFNAYADALVSGAADASSIERIVVKKLFPNVAALKWGLNHWGIAGGDDILTQFLAFGLIRFTDQPYSERVGETIQIKQRRIWSLTEYGQSQYGLFLKMGAAARKKAQIF